ncbi:MAG: FAD-dependent oxidoreductase, partial [Rhodospirillales bacterium]
RRRNNVIRFDARFIKYPFENGLNGLSPEDRFECLNSYLNNDHPEPTNFKEWLYHAFGTGIAEKYLIPYNEKIWNIPAEEMAFDWAEERVPRPPAEDVIKAAVGVETEGYTHQLHFNYPEKGGIEALPVALAGKCGSIISNFTVSKVWRESNGWRVGDGREVRNFDKIVSTIPVLALIEALDGVPDEIAECARALKHNSLIVVMLGFECAEAVPYTAVYVPDPSLAFHRLSFPLNFTPHGAPPGCAAVAAEITTNPGDGVHDLGDGEVTELVVEGLSAMGLIDAGKINFRHVSRTRHAYVLRTFDYGENLARVLGYLDGLGIVSLGRNAEFEYINMDEAVRRAIEAAGRLDGEDG